MFNVSTEWLSWPERLPGHHLFNHPTGECVYLCMYLSIHSLLHSLLPVYTGQVVCNTHRDGGRHFLSSHFREHTGSRMWPQLCHPGRCRQTGASLPPGHWTLTGIQFFSFRDRTRPGPRGSEPERSHGLIMFGRKPRGRDSSFFWDIAVLVYKDCLVLRA